MDWQQIPRQIASVWKIPERSVRDFEAAIRTFAGSCSYPNVEFKERMKESLILQSSNKEVRSHCFGCLEKFENVMPESQLVTGVLCSTENADNRKIGAKKTRNQSHLESPGSTVQSEVLDTSSLEWLALAHGSQCSNSTVNSQLAALLSRFDELSWKLENLEWKQIQSPENVSKHRNENGWKSTSMKNGWNSFSMNTSCNRWGHCSGFVANCVQLRNNIAHCAHCSKRLW